MITKAKQLALLMLLPLLQAAPVVVAEDAPFTYSDDWGLVSAPPPPGPYQAVNIDPRVPGQDAAPPMTTDAESLQGWEQLPDELLTNPPAAGRPVLPPVTEPPVQHEVPGNYGPAPAPGAFESRMPRPPEYRPPEQTMMPGGPGQYSGFGNMPPSGYYRSPAVPMEQEVPPPPVYDAMTGESDGVYGRLRGQ